MTAAVYILKTSLRQAYQKRRTKGRRFEQNIYLGGFGRASWQHKTRIIRVVYISPYFQR